MSWLLPVALTLAAAGLTYVCCVRPMMRGRGHETTSPQADSGAYPTASDSGGFEAQVTQLRTDIERIRAEDAPAQTPVAAPDVSWNTAPPA